MVDTNTRQAKRAPVTLKIKFKSETLEQFIERYSVDISHGGIFIRTKDPLAVGTALRFEFQLKDATPLITGEGTVVWTREHDPSRAGVAPGMGVRFDRLPAESQRVLDRILAEKSARAPRTDTNAFVETPTKVAPSPLVAGLARDSGRPERTLVGIAPAGKRSKDDSRPPPLSPFDEDVSDEAFEENTKVASLQALAARTARTLDGIDEEDDEEEPTRKVTREQMDDVKTKGAAAAAAAAGAPLAPTVPRIRPVGGNKTPDTVVDDLASERAAQAERNREVTPPPRLSRQGPRATPTSSAPPEASDSRMRTEVTPHSAAMSDDAPVARAADMIDNRGSSTLWIAAAAVLLILGGVAGWWYMSGRGGTGTASTAQPADETAASKGAAPEPATAGSPVAAGGDPGAANAAGEPTPAPPAEPPAPVGTLEGTIESATPGAIAELVGGNQKGPTPMKFTALEAKPYKVRVTADGHVAKEIELTPGGKPLAVALDPMPRVLRVSSTPPGAEIYVNGRRMKGVTPTDVPLTGPLAKLKQYNIALALRGYERFNNKLLVASASFAAEGDKLVHGLDATLKQRVVAVRQRPAPRPEPPDEEVQPDETPDDPAAAPGPDAGSDAGKAKPDAKPKPPESGDKPDPGKAGTGDAAKPKDPARPKEPAKPKEPARDPITGKPVEGAAKPRTDAKPKPDEPTPEFAE